MLLMQTNTQGDPTLIVAYLIGLLIPIAVLSVLGASFIRLGARIVVKRSVSFGKAFWITFVSVLAAFITQKMLLGSGAGPSSSAIAVGPPIIFFLISWFLTSGLIRNVAEEERPLYGRGLAVTAIQSGCMLVVVAVVVVGIFALVHK